MQSGPVTETLPLPPRTQYDTGEVTYMPCNLLHMIEMPDSEAYADPDLKDLVGDYPRLFCAACTPPRPLKPSESSRCLALSAPCWMPGGRPDCT